MDIGYRLATIDDLDNVVEMFSLAVNDMNNRGIYQWDDIYPNVDVLNSDIENKQMYLGVSQDKIICAFVINFQCDDEYKKAKWKYPKSSYMIIHRLCVNPNYQNIGIGMKSMLKIEDMVKKMDIESIRLDAFTENPKAIRLYEKLGYSIIGYADWRKGRFALMEKKL